MAPARPRLGLRIGSAKTPAKGSTKNGAKNAGAKNAKGATSNGASKKATPSPARAARAATPARAKSGADAARPVGGSGPAARKGAGTRNAATRNEAPRGSAARGAVATARRVADPEPAEVEYEYPSAWLRWATLVLALAGLGVSIYLTYAHYTESALAGCTETTGVVNCGKVTTSAQSVVFGIPVAVLGLAFYVFAVGIFSPWAWKARRREVGMLRLASLVVGIGFVLYLLYAELFQIGSICLYCTSVHVITFVLFVLTGLAVAIWGFGPRPRLPER
jgi:uncharacterized membrane protein